MVDAPSAARSDNGGTRHDPRSHEHLAASSRCRRLRQLADAPRRYRQTRRRRAIRRTLGADRRELGFWRSKGQHFKLVLGVSAFELLGAIWLRAANELVMIFEDGLVAIVQSDRSFEVSRISFEVAWIELPDRLRLLAVIREGLETDLQRKARLGISGTRRHRSTPQVREIEADMRRLVEDRA